MSESVVLPKERPHISEQAIPISEQTLRDVVQLILNATEPVKIILFGSQARGKATADSDLDLMIIESEVSNKYDEMARLRAAIGNIGMGVDVLVYSVDEVKQRQDWCTSPIYWALREGRVLYESA